MSDQLGIVELGDVCVAMRAHSLDLFARVGAWVSTTSPGELQRLFAEACHRHAWHAELWELRTPAIPPAEAPSEPLRHASDVPGGRVPKGSGGDGHGGEGEPEPISDDEMRRDRYREELSTLEDELRGLRARIDPTLDPGTARTIDLVGRDVVEIAAHLDALRTR